MDSFPGKILLVLFLAHSLIADGQQQKKSEQLPAPKNRVYVIAHRGAHKGIPENSMPAYRKAIELGCDYVEIDVRTTSDGRFISMHNSSVEEYAKGSTGKVSDMTFEEIRSLDIGKAISPEWTGTKVPSFEEILDLCKGKIGIYLDLKAASVPALAAIVRHYGMEKGIVWYIPANRTKEISDLRDYCPECMLMPDPGKGENLTETINRLNVSVIATDMGELSESFVVSAHKRNARVFADENKGDEDEWAKMINWGTDGIQTDDPGGLISFLKRGGR